jgi:hypothetical protein
VPPSKIIVSHDFIILFPLQARKNAIASILAYKWWVEKSSVANSFTKIGEI